MMPSHGRPTRFADRRVVLAAGLALAGAGCAPRVNRRAAPAGLDHERLARGFVDLAERARPGAFDLGVMTLDKTSVWYADGNRRFPMQGLAYGPLAAAALAEADAGRLRFNEPVRIARQDLSPPPSRINGLFAPRGAKDFVDLPVADLLSLTVEDGDDTAADALLRRIGGPGAVTAWLRAHDIQDMRIDRYAREIQPEMSGMDSFRAAWKDPAAWTAARGSVAPGVREAAMAAYIADPRDTTTAQAVLNFLNQLVGGTLLSRPSTALLVRLMSASRIGRAPLVAGLPRGASVAALGGMSGTDLGLTPAANAVGIVTLADGRRFAIAALIAGSTATQTRRDGLIADAARLAATALI